MSDLKPSLAELPLTALCQQLSQRSPTPGGGAAAALNAALGASLAAMALRYSRGPRYASCQEEATALIHLLDQGRMHCLSMADADAQAYAAVQAIRQAKGPADLIEEAEAAARAVPLGLLQECHAMILPAHGFLSSCNPWLVADLRAAIILLTAAAEAAWEIFLCGQPGPHERSLGAQILSEIKGISLPPHEHPAEAERQ